MLDCIEHEIRLIYENITPIKQNPYKWQCFDKRSHRKIGGKLVGNGYYRALLLGMSFARGGG